MNKFSPANSVPWPEIQTCYLPFLRVHNGQIEKLVSLKNDDILGVPEVSQSITKLLVQMHQTLNNLFKDYNIIQTESEISKSNLEIIIREALKLQSTYVQLNFQSRWQWNKQDIIENLKLQLKASLEGKKYEEIEEVLLSMTSVFDESFPQLKSRLDQLENKRQEYQSLKLSLELKEKAIQEIFQSIGNLNSKSVIMKNLERQQELNTIEKLRKDLEAMTLKHEALSIQHQSEFSQFKDLAANELAALKQSSEAKIQQLNNKLKKLKQQEKKQSTNNPKDEESKQMDLIPDKIKPAQPVIEDLILDQSQCLNESQEKAYFVEIMPNKKFKTIVRYRGSRDGWFAKDFHRMSDGKRPTVTLFRIKENGQCIGGFTSAYWSSPEIQSQFTDNTAMVFNLTTKKIFKCIKTECAIVCSKSFGPFFGVEDLMAASPLNGNKNCTSIAQFPAYCIGLDSERRNELTNLKCVESNGNQTCYFSISEVEVWEVIFEQ